jgi:hypothetical protein
MPDAGWRIPDTGQPVGAGQSRVAWAAARSGLRCLAVALAGAATAGAGLHWGLPQLPVSDRTLTVAQRWLVPPGARADFDWLAAQPVWQHRQLGSLLSEVELAHYNRGLVNWPVDEARYREAVLSPVITGANDEDFGWRGELWESLYPRIRKESAPAAAAATVQRHLRERVSVLPGGSAGNVAVDWLRQLTDPAGWEHLTVAAWRAVGIPARLDGAGQAAYWDGNQWRSTGAGVSLLPGP